MTWWFVPLWLLLLFAGMPLAFSLLVSSVVLLMWQGQDLYIVVQRIIAGPNSFPLLAVPFFILAGTLMNTSGITTRIFSFARNLVGHIPGGLGHVNVLSSLIFSGMSGSAVADAAGLGMIEIKAMRENGYDAEFSAAVTAASATIGPVVPPSIPMVLFSVLSGASLGQLFLGGIVPGLLMCFGLMVVVYFIGRKRGYAVDPRPKLATIFVAFFHAFLPLLTPILIVGGIVTGITTPTEAAVIAVFYAIVISVIAYRSLSWKGFIEAFLESVEYTANIMVVVAAATLFGWILTRAQVPQIVADTLLGISTDPTIVLLMIGVVVLFFGCLMDGTPMMLILVPILVPVTVRAGIDLVQLGVVFVLLQMIGLITPPFAVNVMIVSNISKASFEGIVRELVPMGLILLVVTIACILFPQLVLTLPGLIAR